MNDNLFDQEERVDPSKNYLEELVGDGKKFKSPEELARAKMESDLYIKNLTRTQDEMRQDLLNSKAEIQARQRLEDLIDQLSKRQQQSDDDIDNTRNDVDRNTPAIKPEDIEKMVQQQMSSIERNKTEEANFKSVQAKLRERYGNDYANILSSQVHDLGYTAEEANRLARSHPDAFLKLFGVNDQRQPDLFQSPPQSSTRRDPGVQGREKRTWSFYQKMRKEQPDVYYDPKTQVQLHKDSVALGKEFEDGDWQSLR